MSESFFPTARKFYSYPAVRWVLRTLGAAVMYVGGFILYPKWEEWIDSLAEKATVENMGKDIASLKTAHTLDLVALDSARMDDPSALNHETRLEWTELQLRRMRRDLVLEIRNRVANEARMRMPDPNSQAAKNKAAEAVDRFDRLIKDPEYRLDPSVAGDRALQTVFGR